MLFVFNFFFFFILLCFSIVIAHALLNPASFLFIPDHCENMPRKFIHQPPSHTLFFMYKSKTLCRWMQPT